ncbi:MAG: M3 family oligoendopeptidase [Solirubrobacteraceae bacterium]
MSAQLEEVVWDLDHLVEGEAGVHAALERAHGLAEVFASQYRGALSAIDASGLRAAMEQLAEIHDLVGRAASYAQLRFSTDTAEPSRGALMQLVDERATALQTKLLFFELEWAALEETRAEQLLAAEGLDFCRHHLRTARRYRPHLLSEPEERIDAEKSLTGASAWARLFEEQCSAIEVQLEGEEQPRSLDQALSLLASPERELRARTAAAVTRALEPGLRTRAFIFNTLLADKATDDRLRVYPGWLASRNLANEASDESVQALIAAVRGRYELPRRWYTLKAQLLGIDKLADYDRMAPVSTEDLKVEWPEARELVCDAYGSFSPRLGSLVERFFEERWIDAPPGPRKRGGAFCAYTVPSAHPYVMLNYTGRRRDVLTLAHELGHGVHAALAAEQGIYHQGTPLTLAETASVFGEALVFGQLLERAPDPASRLALLAEDIEGAIATVFRQVAMNRFEDLAHTERRERGELPVERFGELWHESQSEMLAGSVELTEGYRTWWSYIPHFINVPGYVYAYAYGQLLALSVYQRYLEQGAEFEQQYLALLSAGGSMSPEKLGRLVGIDLADPGFWDSGLDLVENALQATEDAAKDVQEGR